MKSRWSQVACLLATVVVGSGAVLLAQLDVPVASAGRSITGAYEGWFPNEDGTFSILIGYFNRNREQEIDIPIGPNNSIEPGGPDMGQPTHFLTGRQWGVFRIIVPADFGAKKLTWTIVANGESTTIQPSLHRDYQIAPFESTVSVVGNPDKGDTPPVLRFEEKGPSVQGPLGMSTERQAVVGTPLPLTVWVADDARWLSNSGSVPANLSERIPVAITWDKYRGPGTASFTDKEPDVVKREKGPSDQQKDMVFFGKADTSVTFSEPGEYTLNVLATDYSNQNAGFQCCWTTGFVRVDVRSR